MGNLNNILSDWRVSINETEIPLEIHDIIVFLGL